MLNFVAICKGINTTPGTSVGLLLCNVYECMRIKNTIGFNSTLDMTCKMDHAFFAHSISDDTVGALRRRCALLAARASSFIVIIAVDRAATGTQRQCKLG